MTGNTQHDDQEAPTHRYTMISRPQPCFCTPSTFLLPDMSCQEQTKEQQYNALAEPRQKVVTMLTQ